jgi:nitroimidazol reductase NimA-like FMN-containing flavoprotein (pyridoxamine 5'-phosphate oxidase superfamily)
MTTTRQDPVRDPRNAMVLLDEDDCWRLLGEHEIGRIAFVLAGRPLIFPITYVTDGRTLVFRTAEGSKLGAVVTTGRAAFEIDGVDDQVEKGRHRQVAWSVVVHAEAEVIERVDDEASAARLPLHPWNTAPKPWFVRLRPTEVTGRSFVVGTGHREDLADW